LVVIAPTAFALHKNPMVDPAASASRQWLFAADIFPATANIFVFRAPPNAR